LNRYVAEKRIAGAVAAVARRGQIGYFEAVGYQDLQTRTPMGERSLFRIYSMTRPITAVAVMMLHEEGRFGLDDPVAKFIPEFEKVVVAGEPGAAPLRRSPSPYATFCYTPRVSTRERRRSTGASRCVREQSPCRSSSPTWCACR
jgi:hypothetical protein